MKKLTAGIFATLLAVVSTGAANAEIASKGYVDQQVGTKADATTVTSLSSTVSGHTTSIGEIEGTMETYGDIVTHDASEFATSAQGALADTAVQPDDITNVERTTNKTTTLSGTSTDAQYPSAKAVWTAVQSVDANASVEALEGRVETLEETSATKTELETKQNKNMGSSAANSIVTTDGTGNITASATIAASKVSGLGSLATKSSVATADIASKAVTKEKLADEIVTSLGKADTALQQASLNGYVTKIAADEAYADIATETTASTANTNAQTALKNIGTLTNLTTNAKDNTVAAINEVATEAAAAASAASAADNKAGQAQSAATAAQGDVDALEAVVNNETTGLAAAHTAIDALESGKLDKTGTAARATADASGNVITTTYATKEEIANMATDENLALKQDKTDNSLETTNKTVVGAINEVRGTANTASSTATAAQSAASAAQADATQALEDAATAQSAAEAAQTAANSKLPTATYNTQVGSVSAANMGTTATTVVAAIKEVAGEAATAQSTANSANTAAGAAQDAAEAAQQTATQAQQTANAAIPAPTAACADPDNKCVLVSSGAGNYSWEVIARGSEEQ